MKVVVIDDSPEIIEVVTLCFQLRWGNTAVFPANDGTKGLELVENESPELVILDIGLPDMDGFEVLREIRRFSAVPVIMLTVKSEDTDIAKGLELGADDYVTKPFSHIELMARVRAVMRRYRGELAAAEEQPYTSGKLHVNFARNEVAVDGKPVKIATWSWGSAKTVTSNTSTPIKHNVIPSAIDSVVIIRLLSSDIPPKPLTIDLVGTIWSIPHRKIKTEPPYRSMSFIIGIPPII